MYCWLRRAFADRPPFVSYPDFVSFLATASLRSMLSAFPSTNQKLSSENTVDCTLPIVGRRSPCVGECRSSAMRENNLLWGTQNISSYRKYGK